MQDEVLDSPPSRHPPAVVDQHLLEVVDCACAEAATRAGDWCACRPGCTSCCIGPFPITWLDALRLQRGWLALADADRKRAQAVMARAVRCTEQMQADPPAGGDDADDEAFCERHRSLPCPALDPGTGRCELYSHRPLSCRTYGPPVRFGDEGLPPCDLWFEGAPEAAVDACRVEPDPDDLEGAILERWPQPPDTRSETYVAWALAEIARPAQPDRPTMDGAAAGSR